MGIREMLRDCVARLGETTLCLVATLVEVFKKLSTQKGRKEILTTLFYGAIAGFAVAGFLSPIYVGTMILAREASWLETLLGLIEILVYSGLSIACLGVLFDVFFALCMVLVSLVIFLVCLGYVVPIWLVCRYIGKCWLFVFKRKTQPAEL